MLHSNNKKLIALVVIILVGIGFIFLARDYKKTFGPVASKEGNIIVKMPFDGQDVGNPLTIKGEGRVFESVFQYRIKDSDGNIVFQDHAMTDAPDIGQFGPFELTVYYPKPKTRTGTVEVFAYSAKDGSEIEMVRIQVRFSGQY